ncbi:hypothetical protein D1AOALGA4SA_1140 [Olavius algarvensis Delta 1 endosymbiont]|nr:hypothetical protein D1AOALGA4SA_1140 [Olavius algarvensis Delta 1 endosymbiont]
MLIRIDPDFFLSLIGILNLGYCDLFVIWDLLLVISII